MRFPLLRRLSHLIHRRPKSESFATDALRQLAEDFANEGPSLPRSRSLDDSTDKRDPLPPNVLDLLPQNPLPSSIHEILIVLSNLERRIPLLEDENARLKQDRDRLTFESQLCEQEINLKEAQVIRQRSYLSELHREFQQMHQDQTRRENVPLEDFLVKTLASYPSDHVFNKIVVAIDAGSSFSNAIVTVIQEEIETLPNSPWSKLVPAIVGPRTADQYASALRIVLNARKDLRNSHKASHFWKQQAKLDDANVDVITPSSSILSDVQEALSEERQRAVNDLLRKLRSGEIPIRSRVVTQAAPVKEEHSSSSSSSLQSIGSVAPLPDSAVGSPPKDILESVLTSQVPAVGVDPFSARQEERKNTTSVVNISNSMLPSSTTRSLATAVSISSVSSSSVSSFASTDFPELWDLVTLSPKFTGNGFDTRSRDTEDIDSFPIPPPPRPPRPVPRIGPFSGLETIDETDEPTSQSSSSNYVCSLTSTSANEALPETAIIDLSTRSDTMVDKVKLPVQQAASPCESPAILMESVSPSAQDAEASIKQPKLPMMAAMSKLPRRLSLSLKKSGKEKEMSKESEKGKEKTRDGGKEKARDGGKEKARDGEKPTTTISMTTPRGKLVLGRKNSLVPSITPTPPLQLKTPVPPSNQVKPKSRIRANSGASARPTLSSVLKQTPPRKKFNKEDKENMRGSGRSLSPTKPPSRMKAKSMDKLASES